jgi:hypothetical protein
MADNRAWWVVWLARARHLAELMRIAHAEGNFS